jgi:hypothetical protein
MRQITSSQSGGGKEERRGREGKENAHSIAVDDSRASARSRHQTPPNAPANYKRSINRFPRSRIGSVQPCGFTAHSYLVSRMVPRAISEMFWPYVATDTPPLVLLVPVLACLAFDAPVSRLAAPDPLRHLHGGRVPAPRPEECESSALRAYSNCAVTFLGPAGVSRAHVLGTGREGGR